VSRYCPPRPGRPGAAGAARRLPAAGAVYWQAGKWLPAAGLGGAYEARFRSFGPLTRPGVRYRHELATGHNPVRQSRGTRTAKGDAVSSALACAGLAASDEAELFASPETASGPPPDYDGPWPPRLATESFISHGVFDDPARVKSRARLSGTGLLDSGQA